MALDDGAFVFHLTLANPGEAPFDAAKVTEALRPVLAGWGVDDREENALNTAVEELVTNLGKFGSAGLPSGVPVSVEGKVRIDDDAAILTISDNGTAFNPESVPDPPLDGSPSDRAIGGLGLFMLFEMFHQFRYRREKERNIGSWILRRESRATKGS
jgi:serine/threonine-protein kinase RsbW